LVHRGTNAVRIRARGVSGSHNGTTAEQIRPRGVGGTNAEQIRARYGLDFLTDAMQGSRFRILTGKPLARGAGTCIQSGVL